MAKYSIEELSERIDRFPKESLIHLPTPLSKLSNLSDVLGGVNIYVKREDLTGLAFGGNKSRKLEFILRDVLDQEADVVITWAGLQSNWCLQTAAAARKYGLEPVLILFDRGGASGGSDGNLLLDHILDAQVTIEKIEGAKVIKSEEAQKIVAEAVSQVEARGLKAYVAPIGGSMAGGSMQVPLGAVAYAGAYVEMRRQTDALGLEVDYILHATGSGGTQAGLAVAAKAASDSTKVLGISVSDPKDSFAEEVSTIARDTVEALGLDCSMEKEDIIVMDEYLQEGYGIVTQEVSEALRLAAVQEGIFLDPVYTGKAFTAMVDLIQQGFIKSGENVVFFHTGGTAALFPKKEDIGRFLGFS
jgi:D-cysteine desulfhydrase family pyridoxal phosphate-dependent enzyme